VPSVSVIRERAAASFLNMSNPGIDVLLAAATNREKKRAKQVVERTGVSMEDALLDLLKDAAGAQDVAVFISSRTADLSRQRSLNVKSTGGAVLSSGWNGFFDGAAEPTNPGQKGIGALLLGPSGQRFEVSLAGGYGTNNEAEYQALIALLECVDQAGVSGVSVRGDSQLVVNQIKGQWDVNSPALKPLWSRARSLVRKVNARIAWIPREQNTEADKLSMAALAPFLQKEQEWGNLSAIGAALGLSAVMVGRRLTSLGLKDGSRGTSASLTQGLARLQDTPFGTRCDWHTAKTLERLRAEQSSAAPPHPSPSGENPTVQ
jgi:ribonuclease HI